MQPVGAVMRPVGAVMRPVGAAVRPVGAAMKPVGGVIRPAGRVLTALQRSRVAWRGENRVHIRVRGITAESGTALGRAVETELERHAAVRWAAVNASLGVVVVSCEDDAPPVADLVSIVDRLERQHLAESAEASDSPFDRVPAAVTALALSATGMAVAGASRALRTMRLQAELGSVVQFIDTQPRLRTAVEHALGAESADLLLAASNTAAQTAAQGIGALALDLGQRVIQVAEAVLERDSWARSEPLLCGHRRDASAQPVTPERPAPLPPGPVERYSERIGVGAAGAFGGVLAVSGSSRRAAGMAVATLPKAARFGQESFASALGCLLARRGVVVADYHALRLLDRIDTIVIDADVLTTGALSIGDVVPIGRGDVNHLTGLAYSLFAADRICETVCDGSLRLGPFDALGLKGSSGTRIAARLAARGAAQVLGLAQENHLLAVIGIVRERARAADAMIVAASRPGAAFVLAADAQEAIPGARVVPGGRRLVASVRALQADGAAVLLVSRQRRALAAADVGVGLTSFDGRPAWGAHILVGADLAAAALVADAAHAARSASRRGVALSEAGTAFGGALAFGGPAPDSAERSLLAVNAAGAIALTGSIWSVAGLARRPSAGPEPAPPWHAMPADVVLERLGSQPGGLNSEESRARWHPDSGPLRLPSLPRAFMEELANPLTPILGGGAALSASIGAVADAVIVSAVTGMAALIGSVQRVYTDRSMTRLLEASAVTAHVQRDGRELAMPASGLVAGDVVLLGAGDVIPADCRLLQATALQVDESSVTGESVPVDKVAGPVVADAIADRRSMLYEGTTVAAGQASAIVVATGSATQMGRSLAAVAQAAPVTGVEARLSQLTGITLPLAAGSAGALVLAGMLRGRPPADTIGAAVGLAVASVPEGLPFLVTAAQLAAARRLATRGALVRNPRTVEALGRVNVLCFDKTGTLTQGRMAVSAVSDGTATNDAGALGLSHRRVMAAALRATPRARRGASAEHPTDQAVADGAAALELTRSADHPGWQRLDSLPFEPSRAYHATLGSTRKGQLLSVKGAPEVILAQCTRWRGRAIRPRDRKQLAGELHRLAGKGYRVLAVAENQVSSSYQLDGIGGLSFAGFVAFGDPVRATAGVSVRELRDAGVHVVMITGDHPATAKAIASELEVLDGGTIVTGPDLDRLDDQELSRVLADTTVIARCTPEQKVRVVQAFQDGGGVVAMTGDGANDAAAIRLADIGIALGRRGTPAARAAADLVVGDDRLETIIAAVLEGRAMWRSVKQAIGILVGGNIGEIGYTLLGTLLGGTSPLSARQLLLVNLLTDLVPAITVALRSPPREAAASLLAEGPDISLGSALTEEIAVRAIATGLAAGGAWAAGRMTGTAARARTIGLAALIGTEIGQTLLVGGRSPAVAAGSLASLGILVGVVQTPGVSQFFGCVPVGPLAWGLAGASSLAGTAGSRLLPPLARSLTPAVTALVGSPAADQARKLAADIRAELVQLSHRAEDKPKPAQPGAPHLRLVPGAAAS
jgi:cation-transporting P-type ATPase I